MRSFADLDRYLGAVPSDVVVELAAIERQAGRQDRYLRQVPATLDRLARRARVESVRASSAIEDIIIDRRRLDRVVGLGQRPRNRSEEEVAGYRDALDHTFGAVAGEPFSLLMLLRLHRLLFGPTDVVGGRLKEADNRVVDRESDGQEVDRFTTVPARQTEFFMRELHERSSMALETNRHHPLLLIGAYVLDLLVIHPFDNGNGRTARLATTALLEKHGFGVARYVPIEALVDRTSDEYYRTLKASTDGWHTGQHDLWPWLRYLVTRVGEGYGELERLVGDEMPQGTKRERVRAFVLRSAPATFTKDDIRAQHPDISDATISRTLQDMRHEGLVRSLGAGSAAWWERS